MQIMNNGMRKGNPLITTCIFNKVKVNSFIETNYVVLPLLIVLQPFLKIPAVVDVPFKVGRFF